MEWQLSVRGALLSFYLCNYIIPWNCGTPSAASLLNPPFKSYNIFQAFFASNKINSWYCLTKWIRYGMQCRRSQSRNLTLVTISRDSCTPKHPPTHVSKLYKYRVHLGSSIFPAVAAVELYRLEVVYLIGPNLGGPNVGGPNVGARLAPIIRAAQVSCDKVPLPTITL